MPNIIINQLLREKLLECGLTDGSASTRQTLYIPGTTVRALLGEMDRRYPGMGKALKSGTALAIDGEIFNDADLEELEDNTEVCFIPAIEGG